MTDIERIEEIKKILEEPSLLALSRRLGMSSAQIFYDIRAGKCGISKELILKIKSQIPLINHVWLLTGDGEILLNNMKEKQVVQNNVAGDNIQGGNVAVEKQQANEFIELLRNADIRLAKSQEQIDRLIGIIEKINSHEKE